MANQFISSEDITNLVIGAAGDFTGGLLSSLLLISKIAHRFQPDKQKQALREALEEALTEACKLFPEAQKSVTKYYLDQLSKFLKAQIVVAEIGKLLDPNPATLLEKELLSQEFTRITQGYRPDQMPDLDFDLFIETLVYTFYMAVKGKEPLQEMIKIERLDQLVQQVVKTFTLLETLLASSDGSSRGIAELILVTQRQAQTFEEIKLLLEAQRDGLILFPQFKTSIENFLISYLGTYKEQVPFGGRDEQLSHLEEWRSLSTRQRLLLVAPAGRGKSALLVRWSQMLVNRDDVAVLFMPISARFGTNRDEVTFACLAVRLAHLYHKEIPTDFAHFTPNLWRGLVADYLREPLPDGRQLLLILDGLDEAAWDGFEDIFPLQLPSGIRIVVSARYRAGEAVSPRPWLQRLGWDRFTELAETLVLPELTFDGVRDVLMKMGCPLDELGFQVNIVSELYRLSEGDPLLVELYVKDLWSNGKSVTRLKPPELEKIQPGYKGFFDRWWDDQEKLWGTEKPLLQSMTRTLLNLLSTAWGPLLLDDLLAILARDPLVDGFHIQEAIKPLSRFVLGDGREQGYVFAHPRLGDYFWDGLGHREQVRWEEFFIDWGQATIKHLENSLLRYEDASLYLLQYYTSHLRRREVPLNTYLSLLSYQWMQAWHKKTGMYIGFLRDVDQVWGKLAQANKEAVAKEQVAPYIGLEIRCALYYASVHSLAENLSDDLLIQLLIQNVWTEEQVLAYARQKHIVDERCYTLWRIALKVPPRRSKYILAEVVEISNTISNEWSRGEVLQTLAPYLPHKVLEAASAMKDEYYRHKVLKELVPYLPHEVWQAVSDINNETWRAEVLWVLAPHLPKKVLTVVSFLEDEVYRADFLRLLVPYLPKEEQAEVLKNAIKAASALENKAACAHNLIELVPYLPQKEQKQVLLSSLKAASAIEDEYKRAEVLEALAPHFPQDVLKVASAIVYVPYRARVLKALVPHLPREVLKVVSVREDEQHHVEDLEAWASHSQELLKAAQIRDGEKHRTEVLKSLAPYLPQEVMKIANAIEEEYNRARVLKALASHIPQKVLKAANAIEDEWARAGTLVALAPYLSHEDQTQVLSSSLKAASAIENEYKRYEVLKELIPYFPNDVLKEVSRIKDKRHRVEILEALAPHLPQDVVKVANAIENKHDRAEALVTLAHYLPKEMQIEALLNALGAASAIEDERNRTKVLVALAPHLPQEVMLVASALESKVYLAEIFTVLASYVPQEERREALLRALNEVLVIGDKQEHAEVLTSLAFHVPNEVLSKVKGAEMDDLHAYTMAKVASHLTREVHSSVFSSALAAAITIKNDRLRAYALMTLVPHLPQAEQETTMSNALTAASAIEDQGTRAFTLISLASQMPHEMQAKALNRALMVVNEIEDLAVRFHVLASLASRFPQDVLLAVSNLKGWAISAVLRLLAPHLPSEVLKATSMVVGQEERASVLVALAPYLPQEVLMATGKVVDEPHRTYISANLIPYLTEEVRVTYLTHVLAAVTTIKDEWYRAKVWITLVPFLPQETQAEALTNAIEATYAIDDLQKRADVLTAIVPYRPQEVLKTASNMWDSRLRAVVLTALAPHLPQEVLAAASDITFLRGRAQILDELNSSLLQFTRSRLFSCWHDFLQGSANRSRRDLLSDIGCSLPVIKQLGGQRALIETLQAIQDATKWWR